MLGIANNFSAKNSSDTDKLKVSMPKPTFLPQAFHL